MDERPREEVAAADLTGMAGCLKGCGARGGLFGGLPALLGIPVAPGNTGLQLARLEVDATDEALEEMDVLREDDADTVLELWDVLLLLVDRSKSICQSTSSSSSNSKSGARCQTEPSYEQTWTGSP